MYRYCSEYYDEETVDNIMDAIDVRDKGCITREEKYNMKKIILTIFVTFMVLSVSAQAADDMVTADAVDFGVVIDGSKCDIESSILMVNERTYLPVRELAELLDLYVVWDDAEKMIRISDIGMVNEAESAQPVTADEVKISVGVSDFTVKTGGYKRVPENKIIVFKDTSYLPVREISELLGLSVEWSDEDKTIFIETNKADEEQYDFLLPFRGDDGLYGYMNESGEVIVEPKYTYGGDFYEGLAAVAVDGGLGAIEPTGKYGYINTDGKEVIPCEYDNALDFSEGFAAVGYEYYDGSRYLGIKYHYIDSTGETAIEGDFFAAGGFDGGIARVAVRNEDGDVTREYIDKSGAVLKEYREDYTVGDFSNGFARVTDPLGNVAIIDTNFETVVDYGERGYVTEDEINGVTTVYNYGEEHTGGYTVVRNHRGKCGIIDLNNGGELIIPCTYDFLREYSEGLFGFTVRIGENGERRYGFIDVNGTVVIEPVFSEGGSFYGETSLVLDASQDKFMLINKKGEVIKDNIDTGNGVWEYDDIHGSGIRRFYRNTGATYTDEEGNAWSFLQIFYIAPDGEKIDNISA